MEKVNNLLDDFRKLNENKHERLREWKKKTGKRVIGYFCSDTPVEIISAAGILPIRIFSGPYTITLASAHFPSFTCHFARCCLDLIMKGTYDYLDGLVQPKTCDCLSIGYEFQRINTPLPYQRFISTPSEMESPSAQSWWTKELQEFKDSLEDFIQSKISDDDLQKAIQIGNNNRALLRQVYELRKDSHPPLSGSEVLPIMLSGMAMPIEEHNLLLGKLLQELPKREERPQGKIRVMVIGSALDNSEMEILQEIEKLGGVIVTDDICTGTRHIFEDIATDGNPISAIALRYLKKIPCSTRHPFEPRFEHILKMVEEYKVQAVIFILEKYCDSQALAYPDIEKILREKKVNTLMIETGEVVASLAQIRTRAQALFETI